MKPFCVCLLLVVVCTADDRWTLYRAAIAAADGALRLHETSAAQAWLRAAPEEHRGWEYRYLKAMSNRSVATLTAHDAAITGLAIDSTGELAATTSGDKSVRVWNAALGIEVALLQGHTASTWSPAFRPKAKELASMGSDGTVRIWSLATKREIRKYEKLGRGMGAVAWSSNGKLLAAGTWTVEQGRGVVGRLHLWDFEQDKLLWKAEYGVKPITTLAFHPSKPEFIAGTWDGIVGVFAAADGGGKPRAEAKLAMSPGVYTAVQSVAYTRDGFVVAAKDGSVRKFDAVDAKPLRSWAGHTRWANAVASSGSWIATGSSDETVRIWNGTSSVVLHGHTASVNALAITPDGKRILSGDASGRLYWWDAWEATQTASSEWKHDKGDVYGFAYSPDGRRAVTAGWGGDLTMRDTGSGKTLWSKPVHKSSANAVAFSPDGTLLVSGGNDGRLQLTDAATGEVRATWEEVADGRAAAIAWSPDGAWVFSPSSRPAGRLWDAKAGKAVRMIAAGTGEIYSAAFSKDSKRLLIGWTGGQLLLVDLVSGTETKIEGTAGAIHAVAFHPSGTAFAAAGAGRAIYIFDAPTSKLQRQLEGHTELIYSLDFSADGKRLVSASTDQTVRLWDAATGDSLLRIPFESQVYLAKFSNDGARIAVAPMDSRVVILSSR
jgi:WD40 repeat protein